MIAAAYDVVNVDLPRDAVDSDLSTFAQRSKVRFNTQSAGDEGDADADTSDRCSGTQHRPGEQTLSHFDALSYLHCVSKYVSPLQLAVIFIYTVRMRQFLAQMLLRKQAIKIYFIFPPHLTSASALPGETGNPEIASFHLNVACFFTKKHKTQLKVSPGQS